MAFKCLDPSALVRIMGRIKIIRDIVLGDMLHNACGVSVRCMAIEEHEDRDMFDVTVCCFNRTTKVSFSCSQKHQVILIAIRP